MRTDEQRRKHREYYRYYRSKNWVRLRENKRTSLPNKRYMSYRHIRDKTLIVKKYGGKCACCGTTEVMFLQIDHIKPFLSSTNMSPSQRGTDYHSLSRNPRNPNLQLLCANCNYAKKTGPCCPHLIEALLNS